MNIVTVADIKRSGFAVLEAALAHGPVHLMKRNRPSAVLLRPEDYTLLLAQARRNSSVSASSAMELLLSPDPSDAGLDAAGLDARLAEMRDGWVGR